MRDNIGTVTDGRGGLTSFGYDPLDRMTTRTNPISQTMTRAYDSRDNLGTLSYVQPGVSLNDLVYEYDVDCQLTAIVDNFDPSASKAIGDDVSGRTMKPDIPCV